MRTRVTNYVEDSFRIWSESNTDFHLTGKKFSFQEKEKKEQSLEKYNYLMKSERSLPVDQMQNKAAVAKVKTGMRSFFQNCFDFTTDESDIIMGDGFTNSTKDFLRMAREFDPEVSMEDVFQAGRNLWIVNTLQFLMNEKIEVTPAVFAYSMLYPYTDNYLDDEKISLVQKQEFSRRFRKRLNGERVLAANNHEKTIFDLVTLVESQYSRSTYPQVFESLVAIHDAQTRSIKLLHGRDVIDPQELLSICIEKGGTSVLADGYLVNGTLTPEQELFMFRFGTYLQFVDDIQDVQDDFTGNVCTAFTHAALSLNLEQFTNRTINFGEQVVSDLRCFRNDYSSTFSGIMLKSVNFLLVEAIALNRKYFSKEYVFRMEEFSPFSYKFVEERRSSISVNRVSMMRKMDAMIFQREKENAFAN